MTLPTFVSFGAITNGTGALSVPWGAGHAANDYSLVFVETGQEVVATPAGTTVVPATSVIQGTAVRGSIFQDYAAGGAEANISVADPGDHAVAAIGVFRGVHLTAPIHAICGCAVAGTTALVFPTLFTEEPDCLIVNAFFWAADNAGPLGTGDHANGSLANLTERCDGGATDGNGGGLLIFTGQKATPGEITGTTVTLGTSTAGVAYTIALRPADVTPTFTVGGTVTIAGSPAPDGTLIEIYDRTLGVLETTTTTTGGSYSALVKFNNHDYRVVADNGSAYGASPLDQAV